MEMEVFVYIMNSLITNLHLQKQQFFFNVLIFFVEVALTIMGNPLYRRVVIFSKEHDASIKCDSGVEESTSLLLHPASKNVV